VTCSGPVPTHALAHPKPGQTEASLYNTAKRGYDKAKTHSGLRSEITRAPDGGAVANSRDARATGVFQSRAEPPVRRTVSLTGLTSGVYLQGIATFPVV